MSKPVSKTLIGAFVAGALALVCLAVVIFGSGKLFQSTAKFVLFFDSSISGLNIGSPVVLRGVQIGRVTSIKLIGDVKGVKYLIPVYIELDRERFDTSRESDTDADITAYMQQFIAKGLRARLASQSLLTGQLMIEIDFYEPEDPSAKVRPPREYGGVPIIPTIPSKLDSLMQRFSTLPLENIAQNLLVITSDIKKFVQSPDTEQALAELKTLKTDITMTLNKVQSALGAFEDFAHSASALSKDSGKLIRNLNAKLSSTLLDIEKAVRQLDAAISDVRAVANPSSLPVIELTRTLEDLSRAAKAVQSLAETLEHSPNALFRGKGNPR